jgi:MFS family permease
MAVDLALVVDVLPDAGNAAKNLGVLNIASALPASVAPAIAPVVLAMGGGYGLLYAVAGGCAVLGAFVILPVRRVPLSGCFRQPARGPRIQGRRRRGGPGQLESDPTRIGGAQRASTVPVVIGDGLKPLTIR